MVEIVVKARISTLLALGLSWMTKERPIAMGTTKLTGLSPYIRISQG